MLQTLWTLFFILFFCWVINKSKFFYHRRVHPLLFQFAFLLKVASGIVLTLIYIHFYTDRKTADIFKYFDDSKIMFDALWTHPKDFIKMFFGVHDPDLYSYYNQMIAWDDSDLMYNDNRIMIKFNCILRLVSFGNYYVHMVIMSFIVFCGLTCLFRLFASEIKEKYFGIFCAVFLMPSVTFWGSAVLKDGVILFGTGLFLYNYNRLLNNSAHFMNKFALLIALLIMVYVKVYVLAILFPGLVMIAIIKRNKGVQINLLRYWFLCYFIFGLAIFSLKFFTSVNVVELISIKQHQFMELANSAGSGSVVKVSELSDTQSLIMGLPQSLFNMFFQPFFWEFKSIVVFMAGLENLLILIFSIIVFSRLNLKNIYSTPWFFFSAFVVFSIYSFVGLIVPVAGAIVRYKTIALPFLAVALVILIDAKKLDILLIRLKLKM